MSRALLVTVRLHDARYHGAGDDPPSPARLFQALVAGAGISGPLSADDVDALEWVEGRDPPIIAAPVVRRGQTVQAYVPNNDLDSVGGDPRRIGKIRTAKTITPRMFDADVPWLYAWAFEDDSEVRAQAVCGLAERLYQFGRGIDMAWGWGEVLDTVEVEARLASYPGRVFRPSSGGDGSPLPCPHPGSLASLEARYRANHRRFRVEGKGNAAKQLFAQPPKPSFRQVAYNSPATRGLYELRGGTEDVMVQWPLSRPTALVLGLRNSAVERLRAALPDRAAEIEQVMVGRKADGSNDGPSSSRVRIVPVPSIGFHHVDRSIRRVLVEVPANCSLRAEDVHWAFSGLAVTDPDTGEVSDAILTPTHDEGMLAHYGVASRRTNSRVWRTVLPAALPEAARRRRIEPGERRREAKGAAERVAEQTRAADAVLQALRHADVRARVEAVRVQREPFEARGDRAEEFAVGTRFAKERLWHVEITFASPVVGPLVIGDGRFLGLGVMAPAATALGAHAFVVDGGLAAGADPAIVARALRRAVMARAQEVLGRNALLPAFFSGHADDGTAARRETDPHLAFAFDSARSRVLVLAPHVLERRAPTTKERELLRTLDAALADLRELRAGSAGVLTLRETTIDMTSDPLFAASREWEAATPYLVTRHSKAGSAADALAADIRAECCRRRLPEPRVTPHDVRGVPRVGLTGTATLSFDVAVEGPIMLGRSRHAGGGLFVVPLAVDGRSSH